MPAISQTINNTTHVTIPHRFSLDWREHHDELTKKTMNISSPFRLVGKPSHILNICPTKREWRQIRTWPCMNCSRQETRIHLRCGDGKAETIGVRPSRYSSLSFGLHVFVFTRSDLVETKCGESSTRFPLLALNTPVSPARHEIRERHGKLACT
jgi:hypothetical protein